MHAIPTNPLRPDTAMRLRRCVLMAALTLSLSGCGWVKGRVTGGLMTDLATATVRHPDVETVRQAVPAYLLFLDGLIEGDPQNVDLLASGAETYTSYAALVELDEPERAALLYGRARDYGHRALAARRPHAAALLDAPYEDFTRITDELSDDDVEIVFWAASSWGAWVSTHLESMAALADLPRIILLMEWVLTKDEGFYGGAPHLFLGVYHAALPTMLGGRPDRSRMHFERALEITGRHSLMVQVQMARYYARQIYDRELFLSLLDEVLNADVKDPDLTLQNTTARHQARRLKDQVDDLF